MANSQDKLWSSVEKEDTTKDYAIVLFTSERNAPGIILSMWIFDEGRQCRYPTVKTNEARNNLLKKKSSKPQENWSSNAIKILNFYETFAEARAHLKKAEDTSNLSSDEEGQDSRQPRKRIARRKFFSTEDEESDDNAVQLKQSNVRCLEQEIDQYPLPVAKHSTQHFFMKSSPRPSATAIAAEFASQENRTSPPHESLEFFENATPSASTSCTGCKKQSTVNAELKEMIANMCTILQRVEVKVDALQGGRLAESINEEGQAILMNLPAKNAEEFDSLEQAIQDNASFKQTFVKSMASVGGRSSRGLINSMLKSLFTDSVAEAYSLTGKSGKNQDKKAFISTEVFKVMSFACKKMYIEETDACIRVAVSDWLNQAKVRKTRREKNGPHENLMPNESEMAK